MDVNVIPQNGKLFPFDDDDLKKLHKLKETEVYKISIKKDRNYQFHKKFFALLKIGYDNTKLENITFDAYRKYITMKSGYYEIIKPKDKQIAVPKSISFDKMDNAEFEKLFNLAITQVAIDIEADEYTIQKELAGFL